MNAQQNVPVSPSRNESPTGFQLRVFAVKPGRGICTNDAPSGDHTYARSDPVTTASRFARGSHSNAATRRICTKTAQSSIFTMSQIHTARDVRASHVAKKRSSWDHAARNTPDDETLSPASSSREQSSSSIGRDAGRARTTYFGTSAPLSRSFSRLVASRARFSFTRAASSPSSPSSASSHHSPESSAGSAFSSARDVRVGPARSSVSSYTATVAGATTRSACARSANARHETWFSTRHRRSRPPAARNEPPELQR